MRFWQDKFKPLKVNLENGSPIDPIDDRRVFRILSYHFLEQLVFIWFEIKEKASLGERKEIVMNHYDLTESEINQIDISFNPHSFIKRKPVRCMKSQDIPPRSFYCFKDDYMFFNPDKCTIGVYKLSAKQYLSSFKMKKRRLPLTSDITLIDGACFAACNNDIIEIRKLSSAQICKRTYCEPSPNRASICYSKGNGDKENDTKGIILYDSSGYVTIYDVLSGKLKEKFTITEGEVSLIESIRVSKDGTKIALAHTIYTEEVEIKICDLSLRKMTQRINLGKVRISESTFAYLTEKAFNDTIENECDAIKAPIETLEDNKFLEAGLQGVECEDDDRKIPLLKHGFC